MLIMDHSIPLRNDDTTFADFTQMRVQHYNRTERVWAGNMTFFVDVGDEFEVESRLYKNSGNQYKITPYKIARIAFCDAVQKENQFEFLIKVSNLPAKEVCPWPKGTYEIYGHKFNLTGFPPYFDGKYMVETNFYKNDELVNGYQIFATLIKT